MGMAASQARFLQLTSRRSNVEYMGQQINQQRLMLANTSAGLFEKLLGISAPTPPSSQDDKYYTQGYNFTDKRDGVQKNISWQNYDDAVAGGAPPVDSYYEEPAVGLSVLSAKDGTIHTFSAATIAHATDTQKADLISALGVDTSKDARQEIKYVTIENPIVTPDGKLTTSKEQGLALLEFDNLNRLLRVTSLTDRDHIGVAGSPDFSAVAPTPTTSGTASTPTNDGKFVEGPVDPTITHTAWVKAGTYTVNPVTGTAAQSYQRTSSQEIPATGKTTVKVAQEQMADLGSVESTNDLTAKYGINFDKYTYTDYTGAIQTRYAIGDTDSAQAKAQLEALAAYGGDISEKFILMNDVDLSGDNWGIIDNFSGNFDGNSHKISNMTINPSSSTYVGMFGQVSDTGVVKNLTLDASNIDVNTGSIVGGWNESQNYNYIGAVAGQSLGTIENCAATNLDMNITGDAVKLGGIVGESGAVGTNAYLTNCSATGNIDISGQAHQVGGLAGLSSGGDILYSSANVAITTGDAAGTTHTGLLIGDVDNGAATATHSIEYCYASGSVNGDMVSIAGPTPGVASLSNPGTLSNPIISNSYVGTPQPGGPNVSAVYDNTPSMAPNAMANWGSISSDSITVNGTPVNVWNTDGTLNADAINTEVKNLSGHTTNSWTETYTATTNVSLGAEYGQPFSVGDGDALTYTGVFDAVAYSSDMNKYEFEKASYEYQVERLNQETKSIQVQDKMLELQMKQLDTEHNSIQTELDAVQKVIQKNIEGSFKTFA